MRILVQQYRKRRFLSIRQLQEMTGVHRNTIIDIEKGRRWPTRDTMERLAAGLGVEVDDLVTDDAPTPNITQDIARLRPAS